MKVLLVLTSFGALASIASGAFAQPPLQPTSKWHMEYSDTACTAKRAYGNVAIGISPAPLGTATTVMIEAPGTSDRSRQVKSILVSGNASGPVDATSIIFPSKRKGIRALYTVLSNADAARALAGKTLTVTAADRKIDRADKTNIRDPLYFHVGLDIGPMEAVNKAIATCMADLRQHWGMVGGKLPEPVVHVEPKYALHTIFRSGDYPDEALRARNEGASRYMLMIGKEGQVMDCVVLDTSGIASLDAMGCQVLRERARFTPAKGPDGKPMLEIYITPAIRWMIST